MTDSFETISCTLDADGIATLVLDRPDRLNAFSVTMARELTEFFTVNAQRDEVRAVVVTGSGRAFCAGMDLTGEGTEVGEGGNVFGLDESLDPTPEEFAANFDRPPYQDGVRDTGGKLTLAIHALPKPVIAAINGPAVGIGATMTLAMDTRLASTTARIGFVFGRLGIVTEACSSWFLPRIVGPARALEWVYSAEVLTAEDAHAGGLVRSLHQPDELLPAAQQLARSWTVGRSPVGIALNKQLIYRGMGAATPFEAHLADSLAMYYTSVGDGKEGVAAFLDKRAPRFTSRASQAPRIVAD
ncbi:crotonase/enoyl-CoA hydratase family protein [Tsukamurella serpentis]